MVIGFISFGVAMFTVKPKDLAALGLQSLASQFMSEGKLAEGWSS